MNQKSAPSSKGPGWQWLVVAAFAIFLVGRLVVGAERTASGDGDFQLDLIFSTLIGFSIVIGLISVTLAFTEGPGRRLAAFVAELERPALVIRREDATAKGLKEGGFWLSDRRTRGLYLAAVLDQDGVSFLTALRPPEAVARIHAADIRRIESGSIFVWGTRMRGLIVKLVADQPDVAIVPVRWKWPSHRELKEPELKELATKLNAYLASNRSEDG